ncbi:MarR family winged helix-turn-helix transcriptional regulator [Streptomyces sp. NRRL S-340]|uniref:MarR family winged helix-turn-helix transcriptional regulator n=1 Tax=Streptomyces sp. NRRL S-340 TaxID=1463901 RepID=UPI00068DD8B1|nr:MarR family transcriptional regulator [Streptomyces sp. NRRL S-340]
MSERESEQLPDDLIRLAWTLHRALRQRQTPPTGQPTRPLAQVEVLRLIDSRPGISVGEIATALSMQPNNVSTLVTRLTRDGFIDRRPGEHDRRYVELHPTGKMITAGEEVNESLSKAIKEALQQLPAGAGQRISAALPDLWELARILAPTP